MKWVAIEEDLSVLRRAYPLLDIKDRPYDIGYLKVDSKRIIYIDDRTNGVRKTVVPGIVVSDVYRDERGVSRVNVNPIWFRPILRRKVCKKLEEKFGMSGNSEFW